MRFKSIQVDGYQIFAVTGINSVSFAINFNDTETKGLLGFSVERHDPTEDERYFLHGFKVFKSVFAIPTSNILVSTRDHPVQSFVYDDFTAKPERTYIYYFYPLKGKPKNLDRSAEPIPITIKTEPAFSQLEHDIFFNRGVASSQAYQRRFGNQSPEQLREAGETQKAKDALDWLSRDLDNAMIDFIDQAEAGDTLLGCFYEFRYKPVIEALKRTVVERNVTLKIIVDAKKNQTSNQEAFPREENLQQIEQAGLEIGTQVLLREARKNDIQHNKFMVLLKGEYPIAVWTGSTNLSIGAIHGQTNVGHWIRNADVAAKFKSYWELLADDPGAKTGDTPIEVRRKNNQLRQAVAAINAVPSKWQNFPIGITPIFSPRSGLKVLEMYADLLDEASDLACITLAFGVNKFFKERLADNTHHNALTFFLLEQNDQPNEDSQDTFIHLSAKNNTYTAFGSYLKEPIHQWSKETSAKMLGLNRHVSFIHSKFLLKDPLSDDPIVVTGSANFSAASTNGNDENMLLIRGNQRVADIYFTEFNRLFFHYYFRSIQSQFNRSNRSKDTPSLFLEEDDQWLDKYSMGSLKRKRVDVFSKMKNTQTSGV